MKRITWILILLMTASFSGRLVLSNHETQAACCNKCEPKNISTKETEEKALGTMMLLPISYNMNLISADK